MQAKTFTVRTAYFPRSRSFRFGLAAFLAVFLCSATASAQPSLADVINTLKVLAGLPATGNPPATIGGAKVGIADAVYDLQVIAGIRTETADPLQPFQWHLVNTGQGAFANAGGTSGEDLKMGQAIQSRLEGQGVIVAVLDDALEIGHEDLKKNVVPGGSYNFVTKTTDPSPDPNVTEEGHGTAVAGIIAAEARNGKGGRGVAPRAALKGFNILKTNNTVDLAQVLDKFGADIFNMSFGPDSTSYTPLATTQQQLYTASLAPRGVKGALFVQSSGNGFNDFEITVNTTKVSYKCSDETYYLQGVTCQSTAAQGAAAAPEVIMAGALNAQGKKASYSAAGSGLWVSAPGGEDGKSSPGIVTVDQTGCVNGYSLSRSLLPQPANTFEVGEAATCGTGGNAPCNATCSYTSAFSGTSASAPNVTGAVALILTANPNLTRRDVKHILAKTARKVDAGIAPLTTTINGQPYVAEQGWVRNAAGRDFHNWYGFGAAHVDDAVALARTYTENLGTLVSKVYTADIPAPIAIPDNKVDGITGTVTVPDNQDLTIETVQVVTTINHDNIAELGIELTSPSGTKSIVMNIRGGMKTMQAEAVMGTNVFYGEKSKGTWTLKVLDSVAGKTGTLSLFKLVIYGH